MELFWTQITDAQPARPARSKAHGSAWGVSLLAYAVRAVWGIDLPETAVLPGGKPYFPACPQVLFSVSHTRTAALVAVSAAPVGADVEQGLMQVRKLTVPKLEFVLRYYTAGSMCRRFSLEEGIVFDPPYTEVTLKDDEQGDPLISERLCIMKGMLAPGQYDEALGILVKVGEVLKKELSAMGLTLIDFKIEVGYDENGKMYVVDEITPDIWRVRDEKGNIPNQIDCAKMILEKI